MKKYLITSIASLTLASIPAFGQAVVVNVDAAQDGIAGAGQTLVVGGVIEIGWLNPGTTQAQVQALFLSSDFTGIDSLFNQVVVVPFPLGLDFDSGGGQYFKSVEVVADGAAAALAAYKNATTGAAGKDWFSWVRDTVNPSALTKMAFIDGVGVFPTASDTVLFSDFSDTFTHGTPPAGLATWVGSIDSVILNSQIDTFGAGNIAGDGLGVTGSGSVLVLANAVPEPGTASLVVLGLAGLLGARRRRNA